MSEKKKMRMVDFKELHESWGSAYEVTEGEYAGYRLEVKSIVERVYPLGEVDDVGLPRFRISHHEVVRVLPPKD